MSDSLSEERAPSRGGGARTPRILGIGGTIRPNSSTEKALIVALHAAAAAGAETTLLGGAFLGSLPIFDPRTREPNAAQLALADAVRSADGVIIGTPGYHGSISGVIKNALDSLELTRDDSAPYFSSKPVGTLVTADGSQAAGTTLLALRSVIHAMRGWPTPFGAALNSGNALFDEDGQCCDPRDTWQLATVAAQVMEFVQMQSAVRAAY
jgi:FMN reductase